MGLFDLLGSSASDSAEQVIGFTAERHKIFANNIANIDTPGYRMRDLDPEKFNKALARAMRRSERANPNVLRLQLPSVQRLDTAEDARPAEAADLRAIVFHDDNDRSIEKLIVEMRQNADKHTQAANLLRTQVRLLRSIISESTQQ